VTTPHDDQIATLRKLLDAELERQLGPQLGCWPLLVGIGGALLGIVLLIEKL
jgi:hypothetical protein